MTLDKTITTNYNGQPQIPQYEKNVLRELEVLGVTGDYFVIENRHVISLDLSL